MIFNPELRRNIWLDFTFHRMVILPIVAMLLIYLFYLTGGVENSASIAFNLAWIFIFLWGTKCASETVIDEVSNKTWDFQRQSSISPWEMTWGKLLGATLFSWYGALFCLAFYIILQPAQLFGFGYEVPSLSIFHEIILLILGGLFSQALALLFSLQILPQIRRESTNRSFRYFVAGLVIGLLMTSFCFNAAKAPTATMSWHGYTFSIGPFAFCTLLMFLGWTIIGLQRSFCKELQYQNIPWMWVLFNIFCIVFFSGLVPAENLNLNDIEISGLRDLQNQLLHAPLYFGFFIAQALTYFALFTDSLSFIRYKYFVTRYLEKNILETLQQLPWWPISLLMTIITGIVVMLVQKNTSTFLENFSPAIFVLTTILFLLRDIALIHFFNFAKNPRNATGSSVLYLFILYVLLPLLLKALHLGILVPLFLPSWGQNTLLAVVSTVAQIAFFSKLCLVRWKRNLDLAASSEIEKT